MAWWTNLAAVALGTVLGGAGSLAGVVLTQRRQDWRDRKADEVRLRDAKSARLRAAYGEAVAAGLDAIRLANDILLAGSQATNASVGPPSLEGDKAVQRLLRGETLLMLETDVKEPLELLDGIWIDFARYRTHVHYGNVTEREDAYEAMKRGLESLARGAREQLADLERSS